MIGDGGHGKDAIGKSVHNGSKYGSTSRMAYGKICDSFSSGSGGSSDGGNRSY